MKDKHTRFEYRQDRVRRKLRLVADRRPRLSVRRSLKYLYAQVIDDAQGKTLACASSLSKDIREKIKTGKNLTAAKAVGALIAQKALQAGVKKVAFDRSGLLYHGRVKALADAARAGGLEF